MIDPYNLTSERKDQLVAHLRNKLYGVGGVVPKAERAREDLALTRALPLGDKPRWECPVCLQPVWIGGYVESHRGLAGNRCATAGRAHEYTDDWKPIMTCQEILDRKVRDFNRLELEADALEAAFVTFADEEA